jgi:hypothetical protein
MSSQLTGGSIIFHWLERIGLGYAIPTFQAMGITSTQAFMSLTVEDYDAGTVRLAAFSTLCNDCRMMIGVWLAILVFLQLA